ncbi:hypothetical protein PENTCL1PPCAC_16805, partial [Pristionchus entomophagus]
IYWAWSIDRTIKRVVYSANLRRKHMKALQILICQTLNPFIFFYCPFIIIFIPSILNLDWHVPEKIADIMIHFFPINNAIIILSMTDEYRSTLLKRLERKS